MTKWRLGLDVGTASVGAAAIALDDAGIETGLIWHAVRIFDEPNEKSQTGLTPKKAARREARLQRRQIDRRARRIRGVAHLAPLLGLTTMDCASDGAKGFALPDIRAKAARERVELTDLLRIFSKLAKKRGYAGEFRAAKTEADAGLVQAGSNDLKARMEVLAGEKGLSSVTLGEYLACRRKQGLPTKLKPDRPDIENLYALRKMVEAEFETIWETQSAFHPVLQTQWKGRAVKDCFKEAIFRQRPLKSPAAMVGKCPLEPNLPRAPRAQMAAQRFRIEKTLADLRWGSGRLATPLDREQITVIRQLLNDPTALTKAGEITFKKIDKTLIDTGCPAPSSRTLNIDRSSRDHLKGNTTLAVWNNLGLLDEWQILDATDQISVINLLADLGSPEQLEAQDWHTKFLKSAGNAAGKREFRTFRRPVIDFINTLLACKDYGRFTTMGFEGGRMGYSVKALNRLSDWLENPAWDSIPVNGIIADESQAIEQCYGSKTVGAKPGELRSPPVTGNDTVDVSLRQIHWVLRQAVAQIGTPPAEIIIEFGRDVGAGPKKRNEWELLAAKNQKSRRSARDEIEASGFTATATRIFRYSLWQEQGTHCPYCNRELTVTQALDGGKSHVEHILPRSLTRVGRKRSELVIAHADCNNDKGNRTPWQAWSHDAERWNIIENRAKQIEATGDKQSKFSRLRKARLLVLKDFETEVLTDQSIADFADRQLHQTSWVARAANQWLSSYCPNVFAARGQFTAQLRRMWNLETVIPEVRLVEGYTVLDTDGAEILPEEFRALRPSWEGHGAAPSRFPEKRLDHRHHGIDALVIGLTSRSLYQKLARNYKQRMEEMQQGHAYKAPWSIEPPIKELRDLAVDMISKCNLSHKPDRHVSGRFFEDTAYSIARNGGDDDRPKLVIRKTLASLGATGTADVVRKNLQKIESDEVRTLVMAEFDRRVAAGQSAKEALSKPIEYPAYRTSIWRVRCLTSDYAGQAVRIEHKSRVNTHSKLLKNDGYACLEVQLDEKGKIAASLVTKVDAANYHERFTPTGIWRFYKGDTVTDSKDGKRLIVKQIIAANSGTLILTPNHDTRPVASLVARDGLRKISGSGLKRFIGNDVGKSSIAAGGST